MMKHPEQSKVRGCLRRPRAFTFVELLVVIAIISLLIAVLVPSLAAARQRARRIACRGNLHQLAVAWRMYFDQHNGACLQYTNAQVNYGGHQGTIPVLEPQQQLPVYKPLNRVVGLEPVLDPVRAGEARVFRCVSDNGGSSIAPSKFMVHGTSYETNYIVIGPDQIRLTPPPGALRELLKELNRRLKNLNTARINTADSDLLLLGDAGWVRTQGDHPEPLDWHGLQNWHNIAFMDGHADFVKIERRRSQGRGYTLIPFRDLAGPIAYYESLSP